MITIFAGAGASFAVSEKNFPTTDKFFEKIPSNIKSDKLFQIAVKDIKSVGEPLDIENVLFRLNALEFVVANRMHVPQGNDDLMNGRNEYIYSIFEEFGLGTKLIDFIRSINQQVFSFYKYVPNQIELSNNWLELFKYFQGIGNRLDIFTTNYDLVIEQALEEFGIDKIKISDGLERINYKTYAIDEKLWHDRDPDIDVGLLTKLHGSINWENSGGRILASSNDFSGDLNRHPMIYPGHKGAPNRPPFINFHKYFERCLSLTKKIIFIGFAFRDPYINKLLSKLNSTATVNVIGHGPMPESIPDHLKNRRHNFMYFDHGFNIKSINEIKNI